MKVEGSDLVNVTGYLDISNRKLDRSVAGFDVSRKLRHPDLAGFSG